jgi:membrane-bound serine protease (ClpP class)
MEVFFPSAGILGFLSFLSLASAIVMGFTYSQSAGWLILFGVAVGLPAMIVWAFRYWPKTAMGRRVLLMAPKSEDVLPVDPEKDRLKGLIGRTGRAKSAMLLSGVITIDGQTLEAVSESMPVEAGQQVQVVQVRGRCLVVRPVAEDATAATPPTPPLQRTYDEPFDIPPA